MNRFFRLGYCLALLAAGAVLLLAPGYLFGDVGVGGGGGQPPPPDCPNEVPGQGTKDCAVRVPCNDAVSQPECLGPHWDIERWPLKCVSNRPDTDWLLCDTVSEICQRQLDCKWTPGVPIPCTPLQAPINGQIRRADKLVLGHCLPLDQGGGS